MRRAIVSTREGVTYPIDLGQIVEAMKAQEKVLWLDISNPTDEDFRLLLEGFGFYPTSVDDLRSMHTAAKLDEYDHYVFQVVMVPVYKAAHEVELFEVELFYLKGTIVTVHERPWPALDALWEAVERAPEEELGKGAQVLYHNVVDRAVREYFPILDAVDDAVEAIEHQVLASAGDHETLPSLFRLRRSVRLLLRATRNQRESVQRLAAGTVRSLRKETCYLFRDVHDRLLLLHDALDDHRETLGGLRDTYLGVLNNRMAEVMKTLTIFSAMLLPLTFVTGLWGMNVALPLSGHPHAFWMVLGVCLATSATTLAVVARRGWLRRMS
jgi:magnesium transporter